jgi:hypothetical protein
VSSKEAMTVRITFGAHTHALQSANSLGNGAIVVADRLEISAGRRVVDAEPWPPNAQCFRPDSTPAGGGVPKVCPRTTVVLVPFLGSSSAWASAVSVPARAGEVECG